MSSAYEDEIISNLLNRLPDEPEDIVNVEDFKEAEKDENEIHLKILQNAKARRYRFNTALRIVLAFWSILLVSTWMWKVGEILVNNNEYYHLSDNVLITLLTTTTIEVIAIVLIAMRDLFGGKSEENIK
ncbi:hypothetical protein GCM10011344_14840 [Dokdonia pacifica]|uniref:Uncharacterized protein n=1 Tax=Dokdonia pacifica TaxID=1627892 RepID=A0A238W624_9FLAO|nr:hypothetical protein [Dokdonia pacifica]GGG15271.1 hypothetical protein GCM10011344_14840 [Dokdonia pacifica]SNR41139.1 hypothetical protein SAMN06265376_101660 [Dokdonia pacifica]